MKKTYLIILLCSFGITAWSQDQTEMDTVKHQSTIRIKNLGLKNSKTVSIDPSIIQIKQYQTLDALLQQQSSIFIKNNGLNSNASLNIRGSSAAQNSVNWYGININSTATGAADISAIPAAAFEAVSLVLGSNTATLGSGSIGGGLLLSNPIIFETSKKLKITNSYNSLNNFNSQIQGQIASDRWYLNTFLYGIYNKNRFHYKNNEQKELMEHANMATQGVMLDVARLLHANEKSKHSISLHYWWSKSNRQIPKAIFETISEKHQQEVDNRFLLQYNITRKNANWKFQTAFNNGKFNFEDNTIALANNYTTNTVQKEIKYTHYKLPIKIDNWNQKLEISTPIIFQSITTSQTKHDLLRLATVATYNIEHIKNKGQFIVNLRQEWNNKHKAPFTPQFIAKIALYNKNNMLIQTRTSIQKTYRLPTLNEWYYFPGGNTALKPEYGWSYEQGINMIKQGKQHTIKADLTYFHRNINDWIYWLGGAIWTPHNIASVLSKGLEWQTNIKSIWNDQLATQINWNSTFVSATTQQSYIANDKSIGKQIPYSPRSIHQFNIMLQYKHWTLMTSMQYIGYRFTTNDESHYLQDYTTWQTQLSKHWEIGKHHKINTSIFIENIANKDYQIVNGRPMPPRHFGLQIQYVY